MKSAAIVTRVAGRAFAVRGGQDVPLQPGSELFVTDSIRTEGDSKLEMRFHDNSELDLGPLTHVNISDFAFDEAGVPPTFGVHVLQGLTRTATGKVVEQNPEGFSLTTPLGSAGIRGTVIWASVSEKQVIFTVTELGEGHTVVITTADGRTVIIHIPETGVIITEGDTSPLDVFEMTPEQLMEHLRTIFQEDIGATTPQGFYVWGDAEFIASLGNVGTAAGLIPFGHAQTLVGSLQDMGVGKGAIETAIGIIADPPTVTPPVIPPPPALPPVTTNGTALPDTLVGVAGRDNIITGGAGNDFITTYDGTAVISGGYGSRDFIVKMGDITDGTEIFGDEKVMSGTADAMGNYLVSDSNDYILVRGEGNQPDSSALAGDFGVVIMSGGAIYGDGHTLTYVDTSSGTGGNDVVGQNGETTLPPEAGDTIRLIGFMTAAPFTATRIPSWAGRCPPGMMS